MSDNTLQLEAALLVADGCDHCLQELQRTLALKTGIEKVHITSDPPKVCMHFDPNRVSVAAVERMARDLGGEMQTRFHHQRFRLLSQHSADIAQALEHEIRGLEGVLHASVNLAASSISVAFDSESISPEEVRRKLAGSGVETELVPDTCCGHEVHEHGHHEHHHDHHHHGHAHGVGCQHGTVPGFLPPWIKERWQIILVALCGLFFVAGWAGERFFGLPEQVAWGFYLLAYVAGAWDISTHALPGLLKGRFDTDILMLAAAAGAAVLGEWAEGAFLLFLFALGHAGEHYALDRARNAIDALGELMPQTALLKRGEQQVEVPIEEVKVGEVALVRPGDRIPVDGTVVKGSSSVDQSPITGESAPVHKTEEDEVFAGTVNLESTLEVKVEKASSDSTLSRVIQMVSEAQDQKSPTQDFTQKFTSKFVPAVLIFTLLLIFVPPAFEWMTARDSFYRAMLLLVACSPCALALGTPASVLAGIAQAARNGVLIKGGLHLENLGSLTVIAFDKTGTLTEGRFQVTDIALHQAESEEELLKVAASVEQQSNHPLAQAVVRRARDAGLELSQADPLENLVGLGVRSVLQDTPVWLGSRKLFAQTEEAPQVNQEFGKRVMDLESQGKTVILVAHGQEMLGVLALADTPRPEAKETLDRLWSLGMKHLVMLTGDNKEAASFVGKELGVSDVRAELMPEQKWDAGKALRQEFGTMAMVGDGVNDAPALAAADVGIAMGGAGTAVALETADVALMGDDLSRLPYAVGLSRLSRRIIRQNLALSMGIILMLIVTSVSGVGELSWTVALHEGSTLAVVGNALRLLKYKGS